MTPLLPFSPRAPSAPGLQYFEMPKHDKNQVEQRPTTALPTTPQPLPSPDQRPGLPELQLTSAKESLDRPRSHLTEMSMQIGTPLAKSEPNRGMELARAQQKMPPPLTDLQITLPNLSQSILSKGKDTEKEPELTLVVKKDAPTSTGECEVVSMELG